ncbi:MAG TPA: metal-dependent hydrolase [Ignavibacteria bacterium]|nr:metal-dependent hydrolase [Ignavibacteria bacterium]
MDKIIFHGHSFLEIRHREYTIYVDPFIEGNSLCDIKLSDALCNYIVLTHGHNDHIGNTIDIARGKDVTVIGMVELCDYLETKGVTTHGMNLGGAYNFPFGRVKLTLAHHSSSHTFENHAGEYEYIYTGHPAGVIMNLENKVIYHAGDTALFYDMKLIGEMNKIDYAFLPIGDNFTMGIDDAVKAAEFVNAETVIPVHYNTFEVIKANENEFKRKIEMIGKKCVIMKSGDELII